LTDPLDGFLLGKAFPRLSGPDYRHSGRATGRKYCPGHAGENGSYDRVGSLPV